MRRFVSVFIARNLEFLRDRAALSWNIVMPVLLVFSFSFLFTGKKTEVFNVGVFPPAAVQAGTLPFLQTQHVKFIALDKLDGGIEKVRHHQLDMVLDTDSGAVRYWVNAEEPNGYFLEKLLLADGGAAAQREVVHGQAIRYVDWVLPGVLAVNMMFSCLYGIGYVIVRYRKNRVLRRLKATPLTPVEFLGAQVVSRLLIIVCITCIVYLGCDWFVNFLMRGSIVDLFVVFTVGAMSLISLGLVVASRLNSEELSEGLLNLISWPMMMLSGVWFSLEGAHPWAKALAQIFPLTHMIDAARAIMNDGASLADVSHQVLVLLMMTVLFLALGSALFKWE